MSVEPSLALEDDSRTVHRLSADERMRRLLRVQAPVGTDGVAVANNLFSTSIAVSAVRCLLIYIGLPLLKPTLDLTGGVGPSLGLLAGAVSVVAIVASMRRFWAADHRWRWRYTIAGGGIIVFVAVGAVVDIVSLVT